LAQQLDPRPAAAHHCWLTGRSVDASKKYFPFFGADKTRRVDEASAMQHPAASDTCCMAARPGLLAAMGAAAETWRTAAVGGAQSHALGHMVARPNAAARCFGMAGVY
jgi:hypothetical protein